MSPADNSTECLTPRAARCFDSHPSDLALIECHLRPWVTASRTSKQAAAPSSFVHEVDLYAAGPAELARAFAPAVSQDGDRAWYFLTRLRLKSARGKGRRFARTVDTGAGWWHGEAKERPVVDVLGCRRQVGRRQFFSFMREERGARLRTGWIMSELRLGSGRGDDDRKQDLRVLCKVYRSPRHPGEPSHDEPHTKWQQEETNDADESSATTTDELACRREAADDEYRAVHGKADAETMAPAPGRNTRDAQSSSAITEAPTRRGKPEGDTSTAAVAPASGRSEKTVVGEGSVETSGAAPARERAAADDDGESSAAPRKRKAADDGGESSAAPRKTKAADDGCESSAAPRKRTADGNRSSATGLHCCPQCGFHLHAAQAGVGPAKFDSETGIPPLVVGGEMGDRRTPPFYEFL